MATMTPEIYDRIIHLIDEIGMEMEKSLFVDLKKIWSKPLFISPTLTKTSDHPDFNLPEEDNHLPEAIKSSPFESLKHTSDLQILCPVSDVVLNESNHNVGLHVEGLDELPQQLTNGNGENVAHQVLDQMSQNAQPHESSPSSFSIPTTPQTPLQPPDPPDFNRFGHVPVMKEKSHQEVDLTRKTDWIQDEETVSEEETVAEEETWSNQVLYQTKAPPYVQSQVLIFDWEQVRNGREKSHDRADLDKYGTGNGVETLCVHVKDMIVLYQISSSGISHCIANKLFDAILLRSHSYRLTTKCSKSWRFKFKHSSRKSKSMGFKLALFEEIVWFKKNSKEIIWYCLNKEFKEIVAAHGVNRSDRFEVIDEASVLEKKSFYGVYALGSFTESETMSFLELLDCVGSLQFGSLNLDAEYLLEITNGKLKKSQVDGKIKYARFQKRLDASICARLDKINDNGVAIQKEVIGYTVEKRPSTKEGTSITRNIKLVHGFELHLMLRYFLSTFHESEDRKVIEFHDLSNAEQLVVARMRAFHRTEKIVFHLFCGYVNNCVLVVEKRSILLSQAIQVWEPGGLVCIQDWNVKEIVRFFGGSDLNGEKNHNFTFELSLVIFNSHGSYCASLVRWIGWTIDVDMFLYWLLYVQLGDGGFTELDTAAWLMEALTVKQNLKNCQEGSSVELFKRHEARVYTVLLLHVAEQFEKILVTIFFYGIFHSPRPPELSKDVFYIAHYCWETFIIKHETYSLEDKDFSSVCKSFDDAFVSSLLTYQIRDYYFFGFLAQ